jgi:hypothetical protein
MSKRTFDAFLAIVVGGVLVAVSGLVPGADWLQSPGVILAVPLYPEGIKPYHSNASEFSLALLFGAFIAWSSIMFVSIKIWRRLT